MERKNIILIAPLLCCLAAFSCASSGAWSSKALTMPVDETSYMICGSVLIENNWYSSGEGGGAAFSEGRQIEESYRKDVEVAILGRYTDETGKEKFKGFYVETDDDGYFFVQNVPPGDYVLKGFRISLDDGRYLTVYSELDGAESAYLMRRRTEQMIVFKGNYFPYPAFNRVVNLRHNVFFMSNTYMLGHQPFLVVRDQSFNFPSIRYTMPPIEQYFMDKYPDSGWKMFLTASMQENLQSGY